MCSLFAELIDKITLLDVLRGLPARLQMPKNYAYEEMKGKVKHFCKFKTWKINYANFKLGKNPSILNGILQFGDAKKEINQGERD